MPAPPLMPPQHAPFSVGVSNDGLLITLHAGAGEHPVLSQRQSSLWIQRAALPVAVDLGRIPLLNSRIVGWLFGLIQDGPLAVLDIRNANRQVRSQIQRIGLAAFVAAPPAALPALPALGRQLPPPSGLSAPPALQAAAGLPVTG
jgi:hypothetical protein